MNKLKASVLALLVVVGAVVGVLSLVRVNGLSLGASYGRIEASPWTFLGGVYGGPKSSPTQVVNTSGVVTAGSGLTIGTGTTLSKYQCATTTWNPGSIGSGASVSSTVTSTDITLSGAAAGDTCTASLSSATTSAARISCAIWADGSSTLKLVVDSGSAVDYATGTAKVCYTH